MVQCKIWIKRNFPYRFPSWEYQKTKENDRCQLRQCVNLYLPMHVWTIEEQSAVTGIPLNSHCFVSSLVYDSIEQVCRFANHCWKSKKIQKSNHQFDIAMVNKRPIICYAVGGSWMMGNKAQSNVHEILKTLCKKLGYICVSIGYRICRLQSWHLEIILLAMAVFCFIAVWWYSDRKLIYLKSTWLMLGLFFTTVLVVCQYMRMKPRNLYPVPLIDVVDALKWTKRHSEIFGGDSCNFILMGHSAGAHLMTSLYSHPGFWKRTTIPRCNVKAIVAVSGVYSAAWMRSDFMCRSIGRLVFGDESPCGEWNDCFPCELIRKYQKKWPNVLIISAQYDYGLRAQASEFYDCLYELENNKKKLDWITVKDTDHFSITCQWPYQLSGLACYVATFLHHAVTMF